MKSYISCYGSTFDLKIQCRHIMIGNMWELISSLFLSRLRPRLLGYFVRKKRLSSWENSYVEINIIGGERKLIFNWLHSWWINKKFRLQPPFSMKCHNAGTIMEPHIPRLKWIRKLFLVKLPEAQFLRRAFPPDESDVNNNTVYCRLIVRLVQK